MVNNKCKDCGCICNKCANQDVHLHVEIENLKQRLLERDNHIVTMETTFLNEANKYPNGEFVALREELLTWQDKYARLYEAHKRVQKVNQSLEDKLLKLVDKSETEKTALTKDVATLSHRLADANYNIQRLQDDNEKYKNDVNLAIQLLQCKPGNFVSHRLDSLPNELQAKVSSYVASRKKPPEDKKPTEARSIKVPIPTFPPTAMVYSIPKTPSPEKDAPNSNDCEKPQVDLVSAAIMAKILEEREKERSFTRHCDTCTCSKQRLVSSAHHTVATQTERPKPRTETVPNEPKIAVSESSKIVVNAISDNFVKKSNNQLELTNENVKGPRYCSLRMQTGSKNILLDNIHGSFAPVLYTRHEPHEKKQNSDNILPNVSRTGSNSSEDRKSLSFSECDNAYHKQQRVAEWVQNIDENEASESEHSNKNLTKRLIELDAQHYAQIENNVKNFLFKSDLLNVESDSKSVKKLSNLKQKYQQVDGSLNKNLPTETEI